LLIFKFSRKKITHHPGEVLLAKSGVMCKCLKRRRQDVDGGSAQRNRDVHPELACRCGREPCDTEVIHCSGE